MFCWALSVVALVSPPPDGTPMSPRAHPLTLCPAVLSPLMELLMWVSLREQVAAGECCPASPRVGRSKSGTSLGWGPLRGEVPAWFLVGTGEACLTQAGASCPQRFHLGGSPLQALGHILTGSASRLLGVILGYGGCPWASWAQGTMLQKSLVFPAWATLPLFLSWVSVLGLISGGLSGCCSW